MSVNGGNRKDKEKERNNIPPETIGRSIERLIKWRFRSASRPVQFPYRD